MTKEKLAAKIKSADEKTLQKLLARADKIRNRGLEDEDIILQLVADEYDNNYVPVYIFKRLLIKAQLY